MPARHAPTAPVAEYQPYHIGAAIANATPVGQLVNTTASTAITGGQSNTVAPASMAGITQGLLLVVYGGAGTAEEVVVTSVTATTFTATFANSHSGTYNITSKKGVDLGPAIFNQLGTGMTLTLYNGNPDAALLTQFANAPGYGVIAVITPASAPFPFGVACDYGLYVKYTGTTAGDVTLHYRPQG